MCVIAIIDDDSARPSEKEIRAMWSYSGDGGGLAWREKLGDQTIVSFRKGLDLLTMIEEIATLPVPFVAHFRLTSAGRNIPALNHPFIVAPDVPLMMAGSTGGPVLFHNGTWLSWEEKSRVWTLASQGHIKTPSGPWSDSRAMAFWAFHLGSVIFEENSFWNINEKVVLFGPEKIEVFQPDAWSLYNGYLVSNEIWVSRLPKEVKTQTPSQAIQAAQSYFNTSPRSLLPAGEVTKETSPTQHPFEKARQEYETAWTAYHTLIDGVRQGSKKQMNKKRNRFEGVQRKYPEMTHVYLESLAKKEAEVIVKAAEEKILTKTQEIDAHLDKWFGKQGERLRSGPALTTH
jgi:hypothetical protein